MKRMLIAIGCTGIGALAGMWLGRELRRTPAPPPEPSREATGVRAAPTTRAMAPMVIYQRMLEADARADAETVRVQAQGPAPAAPVMTARTEMTAHAQTLAEHLVPREVDRTAEFPDNDVDPPARFEPLVKRALQSCLPSVDLRYLDCEEYPCIVYAERTGSVSEAQLKECPEWRDAFPGGAWTHAGGIETDGGTQDIAVIFSRPPVDRQTVALRRRIEDRLMAMCEAHGQQGCGDIFVLLRE
jgi:hypothetical protein